jgi:hypothetical protein
MKILNYDEFQAINEAKYTDDRSHSLFAMKTFSLRDQVHVWHWQTEVGDMHKALGDFYDSILGDLDEIMEICMGKYGRVSLKGIGTPAPLKDISDVNLDEYFASHVDLYNDFKTSTFKNDADIQNKLDEVVASINKLRYLLTMS